MYNPYVTHWHAIILGTVEGVTEFLPISSTAHLIITSRVLGLQQTQFQTLFEVCIQVGAIAAVLVLYCRTLLLRRAALLRVFTAFVPTAVIGLMLHSFIKDVLFDSLATILWSLLLGGIIILLFEHYHTERSDAHDDISRLPYKTAFFIGCCQSLAVIPGVSRAAATIIGGQLLSVSRRTIVDFSFLLAVPTMAAAAVLAAHAATIPIAMTPHAIPITSSMSSRRRRGATNGDPNASIAVRAQRVRPCQSRPMMGRVMLRSPWRTVPPSRAWPPRDCAQPAGSSSPSVPRL